MVSGSQKDFKKRYKKGKNESIYECNIDDLIENNSRFNEIMYMIESGGDKSEKLSFLRRIKVALIDRRKELSEIKKKAKSPDNEKQKQAVKDLAKLSKEIQIDKRNLAKMISQLAANNQKIKTLMSSC